MSKFSSKIALATVALTAGLIAVEPVDMEKKLPIKGEAWQLFGFNEEIDLVGTFSGTPVRVIWAWDNMNQSWVTYSPQYATKMALENADNTIIDKLHPNQGFWVMSYEDVEVNLKEVYYPLYDMCVNVNSDKFWSNNTDPDGVQLTQPYYQCEDFLNQLPQLDVVNTDLMLDEEALSVKASFLTNLPIVFAKNLEDNIMVPISDIADDGFDNFVDANGSINNVMVDINLTSNNQMDYRVNLSFDLNEDLADDSYQDVVMFVGNTDKIEDAVEVNIQIQEVPTDNSNTDNQTSETPANN